MESDIGERVKNEIKAALKGVKEIKDKENDEERISIKDQKEKLNQLLKQVGPGEWRWRIRSKINQIEQKKHCYYLSDIGKN